MHDQKIELEKYFRKMLEEIEDLIEVDEILRNDWKDINMKFQWYADGLKGYQNFKNGNYSHEFGKEIEDPDLTIKFADKDLALRFLKGENIDYNYVYYKRKFKLYATVKADIVEKEGRSVKIRHKKIFLTAYYTKDKIIHPLTLTKLPLFRKIAVRISEPENVYGSYIPINASLESFQNQLMSEKMIEHFIKKAKNFYVQNKCGCRDYHDCQVHDISLGCMYMGKDVKSIQLPPENGRFISQEEALEQVRKSLENGLIPVFGRYPAETAGWATDTGRIMSMCFCCPCCCINGKIANSATLEIQLFTRMPGLTVEVDSEKCIGCGTCLGVCVFVGRNLIDGKAVVDQKRCVGCGRCAKVCPNDAISIIIDDPKRMEEHIQNLEESVDVS